MEIIITPANRQKPKIAIFDFDGTLSTLRHGWEKIMEPFMLEMIAGDGVKEKELIKEVKNYIDESTGIQTIFQMQWLVKRIKDYNGNAYRSDDPWFYKQEYNRRLLEMVEIRKRNILEGIDTCEDYLIAGSIDFLSALREQNVKIYIASGTDHLDVVKEVEILGLTNLVNGISGAPSAEVRCPKETIFRKLLSEGSFCGSEFVVFGDGKVEIGLGREAGAVSVGVASDEVQRSGINQIKKEKLIKAGAHVIIEDFKQTETILSWLFDLQ